MNPATASILSLLIPGSAHFALGRPLRGVFAALTAMGLFWVGAAVLWDRMFHFVLLDSGMFAVVPLNLLPEAFNFLSAEVLRLMVDTSTDTAKRALEVSRDGEHLLGMLTGLSGWLSVLWAADAGWLAQRKAAEQSMEPAAGSKVLPGTAAIATLLCPGLGQYLAGHKNKGLVVGAAVWLLFLIGLVGAEGQAVDRPMYPAWWIAQSLCGGGVALASVTTGPMPVTTASDFHDMGKVLCSCAGLVNVSGMLDAWRIAGGTWGVGGIRSGAASSGATGSGGGA